MPFTFSHVLLCSSLFSNLLSFLSFFSLSLGDDTVIVVKQEQNALYESGILKKGRFRGDSRGSI